jgi:tetratricopeptide (TPR) repeat protein
VRFACSSVAILSIAFATVLSAQTTPPPQPAVQHEANFEAERKQASALFLAGKTLEALPLYEDLCRQDQTIVVFAERHGAGLLAKKNTVPDGPARKAIDDQAFAEFRRAQSLGDNSPYLQTILAAKEKSLPTALTGVPLTIGYTYPGAPKARAKLNEAEVAFSNHDIEKALKLYQDAAEIDPTWYSPGLRRRHVLPHEGLDKCGHLVSEGH